MERHRSNWIEWPAFQIYFGLLLSCGICLVLAIPFADRVGDLRVSSWHFPPSAFFLVNVFFLAILGTHLGSRIERLGRIDARTGFRLAAQVALAQFLLTPYYVLARAIAPGSEGSHWLVYTYAPLAAYLCAVGSARLRRRRVLPSPDSSPVAYAVMLGYLIVPILFRLGPSWVRSFALASPLGATLRFLHPVGRWDALSGFGVVVVGIVAALFGRIQRSGRRTRV